MNKSKGGKAGNKKSAKPSSTTDNGGGNEKKKPPGRKNKSNAKNNKKNSISEMIPSSIPTPTTPKEQIIPEGKKLERSNSFISRGLSKLYNTLAGSRDGINKTSSGESIESHDKVPEPPTFLRRSRTLGTISLRKQRRSMPTPLEQLTEESEHRNREEDAENLGLPSVDEVSQGMGSKFSGSRESLMGSSFLGRLKRTFSITSDKRRQGLNNRWSASLQSLQQMDNMVSYEDLSFINYDEFNQIEKQVDRVLSQLDVKAASVVDSPAPPKAPEVVKRVKKREKRVSYKFQNEWDANFDKDKNLYRQSLDPEKLQTLSRVNRKSFRWSNAFEPVPTDYLQLDTVQNSRRLSVSDDKTIPSAPIGQPTTLNHTTSLPILTHQDLRPQDAWTKSRSLTHLDSIESQPANLDGQIGSKTSPNVIQDKRPNFFTIVFNTKDKEFVPVADGIPLGLAIKSSLAKRNLSFSQLSINEDYPITGDSSSYLKYLVSLDRDVDVGQLAGKTLIVTAKNPKRQKSSHSLRKASSVGSRRTGDSATSFDEDPRIQPKSRSLSNFFLSGASLSSIKLVQQSGLCDILSEFMVYGIPNATSSYTCNYPGFQDALNYLGNPHNAWSDFVNCEGLSDLEKLLQSRLWEIVITEVKYIFALQTVTDHFLACMNALNAKDLLLDVNKKKLFSNIWELCEANLTFWTTFVYPMVRHSLDTAEPLNINFLEPGFLSFAEIFGPYKKFCSEQTSCVNYCKHLMRSNILFSAYLTWCEAHELCQRLKLADILVTPMQRLTKYKLILNTIKQEMGEQIIITNLAEMIESVGNFVSSVDSSLSDIQGMERLRGVIARIDGYDVVDKSGDTLDCMAKQYSSMFDLSDSIEGCAVETTRHVFMEGDLKFKDFTGKFDVHCFLLTDILLVCRINTKKTPCELKVCRTPFFTDRLKIMLRDETVYCVYLNEFNLVSTAFSLQCSEAKSWYEALEKARQLYTRLKQGQKSCNDGKTMGQSVKNSPKSAGSSQSGSMELNELRTVSVDIERANSMSSEEGGTGTKPKLLNLPKKPHSSKVNSPVLFEVKQSDNKGQSMPDLYSSFVSQSSSNTLLVPGTSAAHGSLLSTSYRGISYPPPSPTRATLKRGLAFSFTTKNPPLVKTKHITSQNNLNCDQMAGTSIGSMQQLQNRREHLELIEQCSQRGSSVQDSEQRKEQDRSRSCGHSPKRDNSSSSNVSVECDGCESTV